MASSDDEGETFPDAVSDYYFCSADGEPLSFSELAVQWNESERSSGNMGQISLRGTADNGLQTLYKPVKAWKYDFSKEKPEISVLSKDNWIKLQKPRKSFENEIRTILITVHCLHFFKNKPEASVEALWDHLSKVFSLYDIRPSENDLRDHLNFIREAVKRDGALGKSKFLAAFLEENLRRQVSDKDVETTTKRSFIVDEMNDEQQDDDFSAKEIEDSDSDGDDDVFDSVCAICDNGGELTCCEGKCLRSFHATVDSEEAEESNCESLGLPDEVVKGAQPFFCENCRYNKHQCFVCGELGSSDKSSVAEVFRCSSATCGHFYHPRCVAALLHPKDEAGLQDLQKQIAAGEPFTCPAHKCAICKQTENEKVKDLQFGICRRCPTSYHRKCLPRGLLFDTEVGDSGTVRAWDNLLPKSRALIYCLKHEIDNELGTPARNLKFRDILSKKKQPSALQPNKKNIAVKEKRLDPEYTSEKRSVLKSQKGVDKSFSGLKPTDPSKKRTLISSAPESLKKRRVADTSKNTLKRNLSTKVKKSVLDDSQPSLGSRLFDYMNKTESNNYEKDFNSVDEHKQTLTAESSKNESLPPIDVESKQRLLELMKDASTSITLDEVKKYHKGKVPSTHAHSSKVDKSIILARVEGSVEALHLALKKLEAGCSIEDAMAVCEPGVLDQIMRWKEKLRVYLAPFLHGMRYTSFGRHFTKVEKLEKIVDRLCWYVEDGDTIVDFCCGANDFSCLVKKRLDEMQKKCFYKNYDISIPKNDFNFEKRDWMTVTAKELPSGSRLVMGLNPPFGKNASLANQFIDKALRFKPKLVILIVPPETERLDSVKKKIPYDLVWEDAELLAGKSFYLPGSVDVNDKQMEQWNNTPPPLYLWSHPDYTSKHKAIAQKQGHIGGIGDLPPSDETPRPSDFPTVSPEPPKDDVPVAAKNEDSERTADKATASVSVCRKKGKPNKNSKKRNRGDGAFNKRSPPPLRKPQQQQQQRGETPHPDLELEKGAGQPPDRTRYEPHPRYDAAYGGTREDDIEIRYNSAVHEPYPAAEYRRPDGGEPYPAAAYGRPDGGEPYPAATYRRPDGGVHEPYLAAAAYGRPDSAQPYPAAAYGRPDGGGGYPTPDFPIRRPDPVPVQFPGYERENLDIRGYNTRYEPGMSLGQTGGYPRGHAEPGFPTGYGGADLYNRTSTSAMQRYAPRLDELNHTRGGMGAYDVPVPAPGVPPMYRTDHLGFAPGPYRPYPPHDSSGGWLNE